VKVDPHKVVVNAIHNTCIHHRIPIFDTTRRPFKSENNAKPRGSNQVGLSGRSSSKVISCGTIGPLGSSNHHLLHLKKHCVWFASAGALTTCISSPRIVLVEWGGTEPTTQKCSVRQLQGTRCFRE
jgi:hypothetical protein